MPEEYATYLLCREFGWTPEYVENMPARYFSLFLAFMREETKAGNMRSRRDGFYR